MSAEPVEVVGPVSATELTDAIAARRRELLSLWRRKVGDRARATPAKTTRCHGRDWRPVDPTPVRDMLASYLGLLQLARPPV